MMRQEEEEQSRVLYELSALVLSIIRSPQSPATEFQSPARRSLPPVTPAGLGWMMVGVCFSLMVCGSVTFLIGFLMMPWVVGIVMVLYVFGVLSSFSMIGRAILCCCNATSSSLEKDSASAAAAAPAWKLF